MTEVGGDRSDPRAPASAGRLRRPPRWLFHLLLLGPVGMLLWAASTPGGPFSLLSVPALWFLATFALVWLARLGLYVAAVSRGTHGGSHRWFLVAPAAGVLVAGLLWSDLPLRVRWLGSRRAFEDAVATAPPATEPDGWVPFAVGRRLGSYTIDQAVRAGDGVLFYESTGSFLVDYAGFAHLPNGPFDELGVPLGSPAFRSLGGGWYAWTASW